MSASDSSPKKPIIVIVTDCVDIASNELRASILSEFTNPDDVILEPTVKVNEFSVINCNFSLRLMAEAYPKNTIFACIFNPMKARPKSVIGKTNKGQIFMGRNTGAFDWITRDFGCNELYDVSDLHSSNFQSFSGKLVTAPTIAKIAGGIDLKNFGPALQMSEITRNSIEDFTVVHIDNFGMMKFTGSLTDPQKGEIYDIRINGKILEAVYNPRMMSEDDGTWVVFPGSSFGMLELGQVRRFGAIESEFKVGDKLSIRKLL